MTRNTRSLGLGLPGSVQVRILDWTIPPEDWTWDSPNAIAGSTVSTPDKQGVSECASEETLKPPFDLIVTSDTVYNAALTTPLLRTLHHILQLSQPTPPKRLKHAFPPMYVALENRDPEHTSAFFKEAQDKWSLVSKRIPSARVRRGMSRSSLGEWRSEDWNGVQIWQLVLVLLVRRLAVGSRSVEVKEFLPKATLNLFVLGDFKQRKANCSRRCLIADQDEGRDLR